MSGSDFPSASSPLGSSLSTTGEGEVMGTESSNPTSASGLNNFLAGSDLDAQDQGSKSFLSSASDIVMKGIPLTGAAVVNSFYNTAAEVGNFLGADIHKATIEDEFGTDSSYTKYYQQHTGAIEGTALLAGSLIPGLGATKVLKLAQLGKFGNGVKIATGLFSGMRDSAIADATTEAVGNAAGTSLFGATKVSTVKGILAGAADEALQGAVYQTAALATMHANPITDNNTIGDDISDIVDTAKTFGLVGGVVKGAGAYTKIKSGIRAADIATKDQEASGSLGLGNYTTGDRVLNLYSKSDAIPQPTNRLGALKQNFTNQTTSTNIQSELIKAASGDAEVAGAFRDVIEKGRESGLLTPDQLSNNLSGLSKIGRHADIDVTSTPSNAFFINAKLDDPASLSFATHDEVMSRTATGQAANSAAYQLRNPNFLPEIGRATDSITLPAIGNNGRSISAPKFSSATDAFKQGVDIYIDAGGAIKVSPKASSVMQEIPIPGQSRKLTAPERTLYNQTGNLPSGAAPLNSVGQILDRTTNTIRSSDGIPPVVGDIAKPSLVKGGSALKVGDQLFSHSVSSGLDQTNALNANSRYVWAAMRGIRAGDSIGEADLPLLEQAYREMADGSNLAQDKGITTFSGGGSFPSTPSDMLQHIADTKQSVYGDLLSAGKNSDEASRILNAPTTGLTKNFNTLDPNELMIPNEQNANIRHIRLQYDIGTTQDQEGNLLRGMVATNYRTQLAAGTNTNTVANWLGKTVGPEKAPQYLSALQFTKGAGDADITGAGNGFLRNANATFGTIAQQAERMGRATTEVAQLRQGVVSNTLASSLNKLRSDPRLAAEWGNWDAVVKKSPEFFRSLSDTEATQVGLPKNTMVLEKAIQVDPKTNALSLDKSYIPNGFVGGDIAAANPTSQGLRTYYTLSQEAADLEGAHQSLVNQRGSLRNDWWNSQGVSKPQYPVSRIYHPPIDGTNAPFFAYVKQRAGTALGESGSEIITGKTAQELQSKIGALGPEWDVFTKDSLKGFYRQGGAVSSGDGFQFAKADYDFNRNFSNMRANSELARKGMLTDVAPETRASNLINDLVDWHFRQENLLVRDHVELHNAATFQQIRDMGSRFDTTGTSRFGAVTPFTGRSAANPYSDLLRTAIGVSNKDNYPLWQLAQEKLESFGNTAFNTAREALGALQKGILPAEDAAKMSESFGLGHPYGTALGELDKNYYGGLANKLSDPNILRKFVGTANTILGAGVIRLDSFQQIIHAATLPIMSALEYGSASRDLQSLASVTVPGTQTQVPGFARVMYNAVRNYFTDDGKLLNLYGTTGIDRDIISQHRQLTDQLTMPLGAVSTSGLAQKIENATALAEKFSGTKFTNGFIHFMSADMGRQVGQALGFQGQDLLDHIGTFTNRVLGNIAAGQRASIFQGPVGSALGLFQSFQWNMMQQLLRHVGEGDYKALAMGAGMQSSIFGLSSLPGFQALNNLIAERHSDKQGDDLISGTYSSVPKAVGDYLLYGSLSGLSGMSFYSRGDLNPRRATILPVNPLQFPSVRAGINIYNTLSQLGTNLTTQGVSPTTALLFAAEHNGLSRPLSGLAQLMQGYSTNARGDLVSSTSGGVSDLSQIANFSRLMGSKPLDEAIAMDGLYRLNSMKTLDEARMNELGTSLKTAIHSGDGDLSSAAAESFLSNYVAAGGNQTNFNSWMLRNIKSANTSVVNQVFNNFNNPHSQYLQTIMGGVPFDDPAQSQVDPIALQMQKEEDAKQNSGLVQ